MSFSLYAGHLPTEQFSCGSQAFLAKEQPQSVQRFPFRYEQGSHWPIRARRDSSSTRLKPEAANLTMEPAKEAAMPNIVGVPEFTGNWLR